MKDDNHSSNIPDHDLKKIPKCS